MASSANTNGVAFDDANVYWIDITAAAGSGSGGPAPLPLKAAPKSGGTVRTIATVSAGYGPQKLVQVGGNLYWVDPSAGIDTVPTSGGAPQTVVAQPGLNDLTFVVDADSIYFGAGNAIMKAPRSGGAPTSLASLSGSIVSLWATSGRLLALALSAAFDASAAVVPKSGGDPVAVNPDFDVVATDADTFYFYDDESGVNGETRILSGLSGNDTTLHVIADLSSFPMIDSGVVVQGGKLDWVDACSTLYAMPTQGGTVVQVMPLVPPPASNGPNRPPLWGDGQSLYWNGYQAGAELFSVSP